MSKGNTLPSSGRVVPQERDQREVTVPYSDILPKLKCVIRYSVFLSCLFRLAEI
jgi:hypothetical protein